MASGSCSSSREESGIQGYGSRYEALPESSPDCSRFSASLRRPPSSPSGGSHLWLLPRPLFVLYSTKLSRILQRQSAEMFGSRLWFPFPRYKLIFIHYTVNKVNHLLDYLFIICAKVVTPTWSLRHFSKPHVNFELFVSMCVSTSDKHD